MRSFYWISHMIEESFTFHFFFCFCKSLLDNFLLSHSAWGRESQTWSNIIVKIWRVVESRVQLKNYLRMKESKTNDKLHIKNSKYIQIKSQLVQKNHTGNNIRKKNCRNYYFFQFPVKMRTGWSLTCLSPLSIQKFTFFLVILYNIDSFEWNLSSCSIRCRRFK